MCIISSVSFSSDPSQSSWKPKGAFGNGAVANAVDALPSFPKPIVIIALIIVVGRPREGSEIGFGHSILTYDIYKKNSARCGKGPAVAGSKCGAFSSDRSFDKTQTKWTTFHSAWDELVVVSNSTRNWIKSDDEKLCNCVPAHCSLSLQEMPSQLGEMKTWTLGRPKQWHLHIAGAKPLNVVQMYGVPGLQPSMESAICYFEDKHLPLLAVCFTASQDLKGKANGSKKWVDLLDEFFQLVELQKFCLYGFRFSIGTMKGFRILNVLILLTQVLLSIRTGLRRHVAT